MYHCWVVWDNLTTDEITKKCTKCVLLLSFSNNENQ